MIRRLVTPMAFNAPNCFRVLESEDVEGLTGHHGANNERDNHRDAEVHRNARVLQVEAKGIPRELTAASCPQSRCNLDPVGHLLR